MNFRHETIRRVVYALAMLTGVAMVATQFGCTQPRTPGAGTPRFLCIDLSPT